MSDPVWTDMSNPSQVTDHLWLAGIATARNAALLREHGITAIVSLTHEDPGCEAAGFKTLQLPLDDGAAMSDPVDLLTRFLQQMEAWVATGEVVLIHCTAGISRTSAFAIAWLMHQRGCHAESDLRGEWSRAEDRVRYARPIIMPHYALKRSVLTYFEGIPSGQ